ncbi:neurofilament heavy polypeptide-like [Portunus trituberculatus]|uniref:neurofilament heavy polypeptide-like n=1 Tax=Portunus trituberculatus TaxID=210409 RepID=UPI001E1CD497|nr:neurofilament heavy polypeptide-like [Portunus trituberculatus]
MGYNETKNSDTLPRNLCYSSVFGFQDLIPADSPSSMRVNRGSNTMLNVDDDTTSESEPHLLHHGSLPTEEQEEVVEAPFVATTVRLLGGGEVQKITKTEEEDEIVVVDDYLEDKAALTTEYDSIKIGEVPEPSLDLQGEEEMDTAQQKESDLAEAAQETNQDSKATKKDQESKSATDETENEAGKETASKKENENAEKPDSDDEFIELRPENEKVQNAERVTMQTWQEPNKSPANPTETQHHLHIPTDNLPIQKDKASEKYDEEETPQFKVEKVEAGAVKEEYFEGEKDDGRYSAMPPERQIEQRRSEDNELKETDDKDDEYFECKSSASAPIPPEIVVSSPKEKESLNTEYLLSHIYKDKTEEEGKGEGETNVEKKPDEKESNVKNDYANNQDIQNETGTQENLKEDEELLDISAKLLLLDMAGQRNDGFSSPESYPGSPISEEDSPESPTYVNLYQEDDISLLNTGVSPRCSPGNLTPLDPISEHDESEEDKEKEGNSPRKTSLPTLFKSNLSSGVANLSALSAEDDAVKEMLTSEDEASKDTKDGKDEPDAIPEAKPEPTPEIHPEVDNEIPPEATPEKTLETAPEIPSDVADVVPEKPQETAPEKPPETPPEVPREEVLSGSVKRRRRRRKGRVTREKQSPVFLSEGVRTFSNPVSYFGGPNIKYEEEDGGAAAGGSDGGAESRLSIISNVSLD